MNKEQLRSKLKATRKEDLINNIMLLNRRLCEEVEEKKEHAEKTIEKYGYVSIPGQCADDERRAWKQAKYVFELAFDIDERTGE